MSESSATSHGRPGAWQKAIVLIIGLLAIVHTVLIAAWLAPSSPVRDAIGNARLAQYVDPYFQQSWSALDPTAQVVDEKLFMRAQLLDVGSNKKRTTAWLDMTAAEQPSLLHSLLPARVHLINRRLATNLNAATFGLNEAQRALARKDYVSAPLVRFSGKFNAVGRFPNAVLNYVLYDQMTVQFASMYARAKWGGEVLKVQYKVGRLVEPSFKGRHDKKPSFAYFSYGWRKAIPGLVDAQSSFDSYLKK